MNVAVLGAGLIGSKIAQCLLKESHQVFVYNRTKSKAQPLKSLGAQICTFPQEAILKAQCIILTLTDKKAIDHVLKADCLLKGKTIIQMGTIAPKDSQDLLKFVRDLKGEYLECPILGSRKEIEEQKLILMVGSTPQQYQKWKAFLKTFGPHPRYVGEVGKAAALKLAFNQLIAAHALSFSTSLAIVQKNKIDVKLFSELLRQSSLYAPMYFKKLPNWRSGDYNNPNFPTKHLLKDAKLILDEAKRLKISKTYLKAVEGELKRAVNKGLADKDYSAVFEVIKIAR